MKQVSLIGEPVDKRQNRLSTADRAYKIRIIFIAITFCFLSKKKYEKKCSKEIAQRPFALFISKIFLYMLMDYS